MTLLDMHASISHVGSYIQACTQETCERWDQKVDRVVCGNPPAKWRMPSVTVLHVRFHVWYEECTTYGNASPPPTTSQSHWHLCTAVLGQGWRMYYANNAGLYNTAACKAHNTALVSALNGRYAPTACCEQHTCSTFS